MERGGPPVRAPVKRGFGTTLIEQSAKSEGGTAQMLSEAEGVTWEIVLPLPEASMEKPARRAVRRLRAARWTDRQAVGAPPSRNPSSLACAFS